MVFKLVRTDTESPQKIVLSSGIHAFGRGYFLDCDDKRVSRHHGQLNVTEDAVTLLSLHHNPCFYRKQGTDQTKVITQNNSVELVNGDKFGLLFDKFWYELLSIKSEVKDIAGNIKPEVADQNDTQETSMELPVTVKKEEFDEDDSELMSIEFNETAHGQTASRAESPSMIPQGNEDPDRTEPMIVESSPSTSTAEVKTEPDNALNQSSDGAGCSYETMQPPPPWLPSVSCSSPLGPHRERCWYGVQCYRKNIRHRLTFSHPADTDWDEGRQPCPYGATCWKDDPRHHRDYDHPPKPAKKRKPKKKTAASDENSSREVSPHPDSPLPAKRPRKTITIPTPDCSASDEDPYQTDDSDEWQPPSNLPSTDDKSQSQAY